MSGAALVCSIGGERVVLRNPGDAREADAAARRVRRPKAKAAQNAAEGTFPTPQPAPGGRNKEYWVQARSRTWDIVPTHRDEWHDARIGGKTKFTALVYEPMTPGFGERLGSPGMPGVTLYAEVGDVLVVHFRNADEKFDQALTMHPHGVRYNPDYDGAYLGDFTRAGGFVEPGEEFTYRWEATPDSVGVWPRPRPRPEPHAQHVPRALRLHHHSRARKRNFRTSSVY